MRDKKAQLELGKLFAAVGAALFVIGIFTYGKTIGTVSVIAGIVCIVVALVMKKMG